MHDDQDPPALFTITSLAVLPISLGRLAIAVLRLSRMPAGIWSSPEERGASLTGEKTLSRRPISRLSYSPDRLRSPAEARRVARIRGAGSNAREV